MAKRKPKTRNIYVTKEPDWKKYIGITDPEEQLKAYREVDYFVHSEVNTKDAVACYKKWVKTASGWAPEDIKVILNVDVLILCSNIEYLYLCC